MKIFLDTNVLEVAKKRISYLFDEFEEVVVAVSGGKDSTVLFHLAKEVAREKGRLPLKIFWIDQEGEWQATEDIIKEWMYDKDVEPYWLQVPMKITNATSDKVDFLDCWNPEKEDLWIRPKDPISIKENVYGTERFHELFGAFYKKHFGDKKTCTLSGVRCQESPGRFIGLTAGHTYKGITWGRGYSSKMLYTFYPLYDWDTTDIWKFINERKINYCKVYDYFYQHGVSTLNMRVSSLHHETAVWALFIMQEMEPNTHNRLVARMPGIHSATQFGMEDYFPKSLPYMFKDWREYRNYLLEKLVDNPEHKLGFLRTFFMHDMQFEHLPKKDYDKVCREHVRGILANDWEGGSIMKNIWKSYECKRTQDAKWIKINYLKEKAPELFKSIVESGIYAGR